MNWQTAPAAERALYEAYAAATGIAVGWSYQRGMDVRDLVERGITPEDVRAVLGFVKAKMRRGDSGFGETSLLWSNAMKPDAMEERAHLVRQRAARLRGAAPKPPVARTDSTGTTTLDQAPAREPVEGRKLLANVLRDIADQAEGQR